MGLGASEKTYQKFEQNHMLTLRLYIFPCCCQRCINKLDFFLAPKILFITIFKVTLHIFLSVYSLRLSMK